MKSSCKQNHTSERPPLLCGEGLGVRLFTAFALVALLSASSCKRDCDDRSNPDCENYDPCYGKTQPSAKFIMEESNPQLANNGIWYADSVFKGYMLRFRSEFTDKQYTHTWYVGAETFTSATTPDRNFGQEARPQYITISHVLEYTPDLQCFSDDNGKDSVAQTFRLIASYNEELQTYGTFRGALDGATDTFEVKIISVDKNNQPAGFNTHEQDWYINFHNRGDTLTSNGDFHSPLRLNGYYYNRQGFFIDQLEGTIVVDAKGRFEMHYRNEGAKLELLGDRLWHTFKGRKID